MDQRRAFALIFSSVICAFVLTFSALTPGFAPVPYHAVTTAVAPNAETDDLMMASLHLEARAALAQLQAAGAKR
jgi:hypothetical protein